MHGVSGECRPVSEQDVGNAWGRRGVHPLSVRSYVVWSGLVWSGLVWSGLCPVLVSSWSVPCPSLEPSTPRTRAPCLPVRPIPLYLICVG
jgi:hypothetical protein